MKKNRWLWLALFLIIAVLTIWTVVSQSTSFDGEVLLDDLKYSNKFWLVLAIIAMFTNILFEAFSLRATVKVLSPEYTGKERYLLFSAADVYFSAITPFTFGGQPAMFYFMHKDKISVASITTTLILNYIACTLSNLFGFLVGFILLPRFITELSILSIVLIIIGTTSLIIMNIALFFLLFKSTIFKKIAISLFNFFNRLFHFKNFDSKIEKLNKTVEEYEQCSLIMRNNKKMVIKVFLLTIIQKLGKTLATVFIFFSVIGNYQDGFKVWFIQVVSDLGAALVPIPGGIGAREYILIDGFSNMPSISSAANLGLMCEAFSFYLAILVSAAIVLGAILSSRKKEKEDNNKSTNDK